MTIVQLRKLCQCCLPFKIFSESKDEEKESLLSVYVTFDNEMNEEVSIYWYNHLRQERWYFDLKPGTSLSQQSYPKNIWLVKDKTSKKTLFRVEVGDDLRQLFRIRLEQIDASSKNLVHYTEPYDGIPSCYVHRVYTNTGYPVVGYKQVNVASLEAAKEVIDSMFQNCSKQVLEALHKFDFRVAVMADDQNTTDIKEYLYLQGSSTDDGRDWDHEVRGLGATKEIPTCTVGQENVLRRPYPEDKYYKQSILIHELGHSVMEIAFDESMEKRIMAIYEKSKGKYTKGIYMICDEKEYWALGTEAWFNASRRTTLNDGINTREKLKSHDPELAQFLEEIYGNGDWRYDFTPYQADSQVVDDSSMTRESLQAGLQVFAIFMFFQSLKRRATLLPL